MSKGDVVVSPTGERIVLVDVGQTVVLTAPGVRVWDVTLAPGQTHSWHLHHNPYVVLNLAASPGRMDWLDGSAPRFLDEYVGGAVLRPTSPVHRLTNVGDATYRNRLIELTELGESTGLDTPAVDIGPGERSVAGERPDGGALPDGRLPIMLNATVRIWEVEVPAGAGVTLALTDVPHVLVAFAPGADPTGGVRACPGGPTRLDNAASEPRRYYVVELSHLA